MQKVSRLGHRAFDQMRDVKISYNIFGYAPGSVLFELGNTKILCSVSIASGVPHFLKGSRTGWLTAEYAMLPTSGHTRLARESTQAKRNDRAVEISRLIGRSLRAVVDLTMLGERTIYIDCDVLQADGSTRTASITGAYIALKMAVDRWIESRELTQSILIDAVSAVSVGFIKNQALLDLDFQEDSIIDADYNFILTKSGNIIEIQGTAEKQALLWTEFEQLKELAIKGNKQLFSIIDQSSDQTIERKKNNAKHESVPLFSLKNRLNSNVKL